MRGHITKAEKKEIGRLTRLRVRQSEIARRLGITAPSVSKAQRAMNLPTTLPWPDKKILELLKQEKGLYAIARELRVPVGQVTRVRQENNFQRQFNTGRASLDADLQGFIAAVKRRDDHAKHLAEKFHIGKVKANRLAHEILQTLKFRPGRAKPPLSSNFPQRHFVPSLRKRNV